MKPKTSYLWKYFSETTSDQVKCNLCENVYSRKGRGTSSLKNHLRSKHPVEYDNFVQHNDDLKQQVESDLEHMQQANKKQVTLEEFISNKSAWDVSHPKSKEIDKLITEMIALQNLPFNFVEGIGFRRLIHAISPQYHLRGRQFFTLNMTERIYPKMKAKIQELLKEMDDLSFTTDIWSEPSAGSLLSVTCHGITSEFKRLNIMLKCETFEGRHTGENVAQKFIDILNYWEIPPQKVHCMVRDGGANMRRTFQLSSYYDIDCTAHKIQLCIRSALESEERVSNLITKCKHVATHFKHSVLAQEQLHDIQKNILNQSALSVIQDCSTRWDSTLYMMERLLQIKDSLSLYASKNTHVQQIYPQEWLDVDKYVRILKPFQETTKTLSSLQTSISSVIPLIHVLKTSLQEEHQKTDTNTMFKNVIEKLTSELNARFGDIENNSLFALATYLDARFKLKFFSEITKNKVQDDILSLIRNNEGNANEGIRSSSPISKRQRLDNSLEDDEAQPSASGTQKQFSSKKLTTISTILMDVLDSDDENDNDDVKNSTADETTRVMTMLNEYNNTKKLRLDKDPLLWWKENSKFQKLYKIIRKFLSPPPASIPSEQLFSGADLIYGELRNHLEGEKVCKLLFIKYNLPILNFEY